MADQIALRPVVEDNLAMLEALTGDDLAQTGEFGWYGWRDNRRWRREWAENRLFSDDGGVLVVVRGGERLGIVNWRRKHATPAAHHWEIGIALLPEARGHGYGTEAHRLLVRYLFAHTPCTGSRRPPRQATSPSSGPWRRPDSSGRACCGIGWRDGAWRDGVWYSVLRTDLGS